MATKNLQDAIKIIRNTRINKNKIKNFYLSCEELNINAKKVKLSLIKTFSSIFSLQTIFHLI